MKSAVTLDDKYTEKSGRIYLNGLQAIVRLPIMQHRLDVAKGLKTGTFISGYRGSPLGAIDLALNSAQKYLEEHNVKFIPGVNEDLAATAVWGSQQLNLGPGAQFDGIVGMWYGKGPGVDRSIDAIKHANAAGSSKHGGVLAFSGDDHACKSSTFPHQSEQAFIHAMVPVLSPSSIQDALDLGLHGIAMSRYSGCWTGFKVISDFADSSASVYTDPFALDFKTPTDFAMPEKGLNIRWYDPPVQQEERLINFKLPAAKAYARANGLDRLITNPSQKRIAIVTTGKAYADTMQAFEDLGISPKRAEEMGIAIYKVALVWPLEEQGILKLADGATEILVIEEKRSLIEDQIRKLLYNMPADRRPRITGKTDETGAPQMPENYELTSAMIAEVLVNRLRKVTDVSSFENRISGLKATAALKSRTAPVARVPYFCSGCPHNTSTVVPEGSRALAGIGCHYMATWIRPDSTAMFTQMGGEGVPWIGQQPFTSEKHVFANLGDGTYFHSGLLAIRASVSAKSNITYKILYNDAVAMTGGQHVDGELSVAIVARQVFEEGVKKIRVVSDEPEKYGSNNGFPAGTTIHHRKDLDAVQQELRDTPGTTVLIYDQTCAAEKRRRRKRGLMEDPAKRVVINERVCEGCGDCGVQSNCVSIAPAETEFGRKRQIDQSSCNKDYSCVKGFCPSFVTITGGGLKKPQAAKTDGIDAVFKDLPEPSLPALDKPVSIFVTGVGGTGVVTIGAIIAMAGHLEDKGTTTMDQTGLAQKGGAVTSHIRLGKTPEDIHNVRISPGGADVVLGCDMLVMADGDSLSKVGIDRTKVVLNTHETQTGDFTKNPDWQIQAGRVKQAVEMVAGKDNVFKIEATRLATALLGDSIATNMFMLGYAWQKGLIPLSDAAILRAIELNGAAVKMNQAAFLWGRRTAWNPEKVSAIAIPPAGDDIARAHRKVSETLDEMIERRVASLTGYQSASYAAKYKKFVDQVRAAEEKLNGKAGPLTENVARYYYKLMAYKDEYEVARLYTDGAFIKQVKDMFDGDYKLNFNLAPPLLAKRDGKGKLLKMEFGPWMLHAFGILAPLKFLRGTPLDIFGYTHERQTERQLIRDYKRTIESLLPRLTPENHTIAADIAGIPEQIRGYGHVKEGNLEKAKKLEAELLVRFDNPQTEKKAA